MAVLEITQSFSFLSMKKTLSVLDLQIEIIQRQYLHYQPVWCLFSIKSTFAFNNALYFLTFTFESNC